MRKLIERALPEEYINTETHDKVLADFMVYYKAHSLAKTAPYNDVDILLNELEKRGVVSAVITNKAHIAATAITEHFFGDKIQKIYGQRDSVPTKPNPEIIYLALSEMGLKAEE